MNNFAIQYSMLMLSIKVAPRLLNYKEFRPCEEKRSRSFSNSIREILLGQATIASMSLHGVLP